MYVIASRSATAAITMCHAPSVAATLIFISDDLPLARRANHHHFARAEAVMMAMHFELREDAGHDYRPRRQLQCEVLPRDK